MLGLKLRDEFLGPQMHVAIELSTSDDKGAAQKSPEEILSITYPTADVQIALKAISQKRTGHPIILMGGRGRGKSHIMAVMHHAIKTPAIVDKWLCDWASELETASMKDMRPVEGFTPISEPVHNHEYPLLWELLFARHPKGEYFSGQFALLKQPFPPRKLLESMFEINPTCLILDEFQTWFEGLPDKDPKTGYLPKQWAYNFIQNLSEIATDRPEILILVTSVLDNQNGAFQQLYRQSPVLINFHGPTAKEDRKRLLMHRLFENRRQIAPSQINDVAGVYGNERIRLLHQDKTEVEKQRLHSETCECWPFSPELLDLLEDHILLSQAAQETRDIIRILAQVYKSSGEISPVITPADFSVDGNSEEAQDLVDAIADQVSLERLREIAQRNLEAVTDAGALTPHARELLSSIWMRSLTPGPSKGGRPVDLHLDITRDQAVDDNAFQAEMAILVETSFNIHSDDAYGGRLWFGINENPRSKVRASAKNDKLWQIGAVVSGGQSTYPGKDIDYIRDTMRHILSPETSQAASRAIVLGPKWRTDPWNEVDDLDKPGKWDRLVLLVIPEQINSGTGTIDECLGRWLAEHVNKRRNTVRFLMPASGNIGLFQDKDLINLARCSYLCSISGWGADAAYKTLHQEFDRPFRQLLEKMYNRFAILRKWNYQSPEKCEFSIEKITGQGRSIPSAVEQKIISDIFDRDEFRKFLIKRAEERDFMGSVIDDLAEPPPPSEGEAIPFIGETQVYELVLDVAAEGHIAVNRSGSWIVRRPEDTTDSEARAYIKSKAFCIGQEMRQIQLGLPGNVGGGSVKSTSAQSPVPGQNPTKEPGSIITANGNELTTKADAPFPLINQAEIQTKRSVEPATGVNLSGLFETWGIASPTLLETAKIEFSDLTVQQLRQVLQRIPSNLKASIEISFKERTDQ